MLVAGGIGGLRLSQERMSTNYKVEMEMRLTLELGTFPKNDINDRVKYNYCGGPPCSARGPSAKRLSVLPMQYR
jgi:hypothetical protein